MSLSIPKISLTRSGKNYGKFDFTHDVNTSSDFCFVQPLMCKLLAPKSSASVKVSSFVRMGAMVTPTFGRVSWRVYHQFVRCADLFMPFENMLSGQSYNTSAKSYVPTSVPVISVGLLTKLVLANGVMDVFGGESLQDMYLLTGQDAINARNQYGTSFGRGLSSSTSILPYLSTRDTFQGDFDQYDFVLTLGLSESDYYAYGIKLNNNGTRLRKIILGLGLQLDPVSTEKVNILPLFAYFKAYFEIFNPQRTDTWTKTNAYKFLDICRVNGLYDIDTMLATASYNALFGSFFQDLQNCFYTQNPDFVSAHISTPSISSVGSSIVSTDPMSLGTATPTVSSVNHQPTLSNLGDGSPYRLNQTKLNILSKLYSFVNKNTVIGGKIGEYLRVHYGADYIDNHESLHIGNSTVECQIGDVMSTSDTAQNGSGSFLGEYAGKGIGYSGEQNPTHKFTTDSFGYWVTLACIVPQSGFVQMIDQSFKAIDRFSFFADEFDGVGFEITNKSGIYGSHETNMLALTRNPESFGYIPRYTGAFKVAPNVLNGVLSQRSTRNSYLPYTLDRYITPEIIKSEDLGNNNVKLTFTQPTIPIASDSWRYLGRWDYLGNLNRIFYNSGNAGSYSSDGMSFMEDNFIVHNVIDMKVTAPMKSIADSFETQDDDEKYSVNVEHS